MEGAKQANRLTDERKVSSSDEMRMPVTLRLMHSFLCILPILREMAIKHLGLDLSMTYDGINPLKFISKDSLLNLKDACDTRKIKDFLQCLFVKSGAVDILGRGKTKFKMFICKMSPEEYGYYIQNKGKLTEETEDKDQEILRLCVNELDPSQLFEDLRNRHLVEEIDREQVMNCIPRKQRIEFLIGRLNFLKRNEMMKLLLDHCKKRDNQFLKKRIDDIYGGNTEAESLLGQKLFTADFTLSIQESTGASKVDIQNRKWHLDTVEANKEETVIMGLIPDLESTEENAITTEKQGLKRRKKIKPNEEKQGLKRRKKIKPNEGKLHQKILSRCLLELVNDLAVTNVCMYIQQRGVLNDVTVRDIMEQNTTSDKTRELIKQIQQRDHDTYEMFKECLVQAKQEFLKKMLEEEEAKLAK